MQLNVAAGVTNLKKVEHAKPASLPRLLHGLSHMAPVGLVSALLALSARADDWAPNLTTTAAWNSNATRADTSAEQIDSLQIKADILASQRYEFGRQDALYLRGHLAGDWWPRYNALLSGAAGGRAEWQHKFGTNPFAPVVSVEGAADTVSVRESNRRGIGTGVTASLRKRFNDRTRAMIWHEVSWFDARHGAFDYTASESAIELARDFTDVTRITLTGRFRDGDIVSYAAGSRPDLEALAPNRVALATFDRPMTAYRVDAKTWSGRLALIRALDEHSAIVLAYERRETERRSLQFGEHVLSVGLIHQF